MKIIIDDQGFAWKNCKMCGAYVECDNCGNNTCNGGTGDLADGTECGCEAAYNHSDQYHKEGLVPELEELFKIAGPEQESVEEAIFRELFGDETNIQDDGPEVLGDEVQ